MNIQAWLDRITNSPPPSPTEAGRKRKQGRLSRQIPTPAASTGTAPSNSTMEPSTPSRKRPRVNPNDDNNNEAGESEPTPRATRSEASASSSRGSRSSSRASPVKRLARLDIAPENPVVVTQINYADPRLPDELKQMVREMRRFNKGVRIVPRSLAAEVARRREEKDQHFHEFDEDGDSVFFREEDDGHEYDRFGDLTLKEIMAIYHAGIECHDGQAPEPTWNMMVHCPILITALGVPMPSHQRPPDSQSSSAKVHALPCTTARLNGESRGTKMVDYCIFIEPTDTPSRDAIKTIRQRSPYATINHTDLFSLLNRPIVVSAESKKPGEDWSNAQLQVAVWQADQWALLEKQQQQQGNKATTGSEQQRLPFLPALIIQGHEWYFAASTKRDRTTILWSKQHIGSTDHILGIFSIICAIRHIAVWARQTYWSWYRREILNLS